MKYSKKFEKEYLFLLENQERYNWYQPDYFEYKYDGVCGIPYDIDGVDAKQAFYIYDSQGKKVPCNEPEIFRVLVNTKRCYNLERTSKKKDGYIDEED